MIAQNFEYSAPTTLTDALERLADGNAKPLAGGMSLIPLMKLRLASPESLVDIGRLADLNYIREEKGEIHIGATTTHYEVESSPLVRDKCQLLAEVASHIGDVQVRNMGTIGGSAAHADPAADYPAALFALEAKFKLISSQGERLVSVGEFFVDTFTTALASGEIVAEVTVPVEGASEGASYQKVAQPASGFAIVGVAARVRLANGKVAMARIGVTGLAGKAYRATKAEKALEGTAGTPGDVENAAKLVADGVEPNSDLFASAEYRAHLARIYAARALVLALARTA